MSAVQHVTYLAREIGPRGSTTPGEARAAEYAAEVLAGCGLEPETESFTSARSAWYPSALFAGLLLIALACFLLGGTIGGILATALGAVSVASVLLELAFRPNPLRWLLPRGTSRNVSAKIPARGEARRKVILLGHLDTHRTPIVFSSNRWLRFFRTLIPLGLVASLVMVAIFAAGLVLQGVARSTMMTVMLLTLVELDGVGERHAGTAAGLFFAAAELGGMLGPLGLGLLYDWTHGFAAGLAVFSAIAAALVSAVAVLRRLADPRPGG